MSQKPIVLITSRFDHGTYLQVQSDPDVQFYYDRKLQNLEKHWTQATGLITRSSIKIDKDLLNKLPHLKFVITATSGFDHLDLEELENRKIQAFHIPETQSVAAAEMTILLMLAACRKFSLAQKQLQNGDWQREILLGRQLSGLTLGIVGLGRVGKEVAKRAQALGLKVQAFDPYLTEHDPNIPMMGYEELLRSSQIVSLHVPKTKRTRHMIKKETLSWMSTKTILINMSRGDVIHEVDLIQHLIENKDFVAALDVFEKEPLSVDSPLMHLSNVLMSPHIGASTTEALKASSVRSIQMAKDWLNNKALPGSLPPNTLWWGE